MFEKRCTQLVVYVLSHTEQHVLSRNVSRMKVDITLLVWLFAF